MEESSEIVEERKKKASRNKYVLIAVIIFVLLIIALVFSFLSWESKPDPASEKIIREQNTFDVAKVEAMLSISSANELLTNMKILQVPEALPALANILRNTALKEYVRFNTAAVMGAIGTFDSREILIEVLEKTERPFYGDGRELWSRIVDALACCIEKEDPNQLMIDLGHKNAQVRWIAATQLGKRKYVQAVDKLIKQLDDSDADARLGATWALGEIKDPRGIEQLIAIVEKDRTGGSRISAIEAMGKVRSDRAIQVLQSIEPNDPEYWKAEKTLKEILNN